MKVFTHLFIFSFFSLVLLHSCLTDFRSVKGNGNIVNKEISISDYHEISISGVADVVYEQQSAKEPYLQICVDENILPLIESKVENGKLIIQPVDHQNIQPTRFTIYTNSVNLNNVNLAGSGEIHLKGEINSKDMRIEISGSGEIASDSLYCEKLSLQLSGSGTAHLKGASNESIFKVSGSGDINAYPFSVQDLTCQVNGSGGIEVAVGRKLSASVSGSGNVRYKGNPGNVSQNVSGSGEIQRVD